MAVMRVDAHPRNKLHGNPGQGQGQSTAQQRGQRVQQQQRIPSADEFPVLNGHLSTSGSENGVNSQGTCAHEHGTGVENGHANRHAHSNTTTNGHSHYQNGWANAMNGKGPTAAQILREGSRGASPVPKPVPSKVHAHAPPLDNRAAVASKAGDAAAGKTASISVKENLKPVEVKIAA